MKYLLDTDICIYIIRRRPESVLRRITDIDPLDIGISVITIAELEFGIAKSLYPDKNCLALEQFLLPFSIHSFSAPDARVYGKLRHNLQSRGKPIGSMDMLIAAQAIAQNCTLVSNNIKEFSRIKDLQLENWID